MYLYCVYIVNFQLSQSANPRVASSCIRMSDQLGSHHHYAGISLHLTSPRGGCTGAHSAEKRGQQGVF